MPRPTYRCNAGRRCVERLVLVASDVVHLVHKDGHVRSAPATHFVESVGLTYRPHTERANP